MYRPDSNPPLLTAEEFYGYDDGTDEPTELVRGLIVREPRPAQEHGRVQVNLASELNAFVRKEQLGYVVAESGFILAHDPDTVRGPDVAFVARARYGSVLPTRFADFPPDLAVEVVSPSDTADAMQEKVADYFNAGAQQVWVVYPRRRQLVQYLSPADARILSHDDELDGGELLPGFKLRIGVLFD